MINKYLWGSLIFFLGCVFNLVDAIVNRRNLYIIFSAILFNIGSIFFIYDAYNKIQFEKVTTNIINGIQQKLHYNRRASAEIASRLAPEAQVR